MDLININSLSVDQRLMEINLSLASGEMLGIIGANGAGKSTLLQCLANILPYQGSIHLRGKALDSLTSRHRAQQIGFLPQSNQSAWALSVADVIGLGRLPWGDNNQIAIDQAAVDTGVSTWLNRNVSHLSGGQQARVWLARVLAGQPAVLLADEPVASLDLHHQQRVLHLLRKYARGQRSVVLSIHDLSLAARFCDRLCLLHQGQLIAVGSPAQVLTHEHLQRAFHIDAHIDLTSHPPIVVPK